MKRVISWTIVLFITLLISVMLFFTGKLHKAILSAGRKGMEGIPKEIQYSIDKEPFKKIRATKKAAVDIKGVNHIIVIKYKDEQGETKEITKKFKAKIGKRENLDLVKLLNNDEKWITYTKEKR